MAMLNNSVVIPQEICGLICEDPSLTHSDLYSLCLVSRAFREEAGRILNICMVKLRGKRKIKTFCEKIIARRYLAESLDTLTIHMPFEGTLQADELSQITQALHLCTNLKHLYILHDGSKWMQNKAGKATQALIISDNYRFKLKTFTSSYFSHAVLASFLFNQPMIDTLIMESKRSSTNKWRMDRSYPLLSSRYLKKLSCSGEVIQELYNPFADPIDLELLHLTFVKDDYEWEIIRHLERYRWPLKGLSITRHQIHRYGKSMKWLIHDIASQFPDIKFLRILDLFKSTTTYNTLFFPPICNFTQLETLILHSPMMDTPRACQDSSTVRMISISAYPDLWTAQGRLNLATRIMHTLPTLRRFILIEKTLSEYTRDEFSRVVKSSVPTSEKDPNEWPKYDNNITSYQELWKS